MKTLRSRSLKQELLAGVWCNLGSSLTAEMAGLAGFDWVLLDVEHGAGDHSELLHQLQAVDCTAATPIVRIAWNDPIRVKRVLDLGAAGIMVPYVNTAEEAKAAVAAMRFPPAGIRGAAKMTRATSFGNGFDDYFKKANDELLTIVQIETVEAVKNAADIAAVDGVDVLFVGPLDLSVNLGTTQNLNEPKFKDALNHVAEASRAAGKSAGILLGTPSQVRPILDLGFTFVALGSDGGMVASGMKSAVEALRHPAS